MPFALIIAFAASLAVHALAILGTDVDLSIMPDPPPLVAELLPVPKPEPKPEPPEPPLPEPPKPKPKAKPAQRVVAQPKLSPSPAEPVASASPVLSAPESSAASMPGAPPAVAPVEVPATEVAPVESRFPARGMIRYRVDRGDQAFVVGHSTHNWEVIDGAYRITSVTETVGLIALFKPVLIELESRGRLTADGLQPESFMIRRKGRVTKENAQFDWAQMQIKIGNAAAQPLSHGSQDLLSFHYQLGFLPHPEADNTLQIATGKKYVAYRFEALGDEEIVVPAGTFRTLHLRAPGSTTTELWLAYDYLLLPVKIRHLDHDGDSFVQVATEIRLSKE